MLKKVFRSTEEMESQMVKNPKTISNHGVYVTSSTTSEKVSIGTHLMNDYKEKRILTRPDSFPMMILAPPFVAPKTNVALEKAIKYEVEYGRRKLDPNMDTRKLRRTVSNRLSAQRSRARKADYVSHMEKLIEDLKESIAVLNPQIRGWKKKMELLGLENTSLQNKVQKLSAEAQISELELEKKKLEVERLRKIEENARIHYSNYSKPSPKKLKDTSFKKLTGLTINQLPSNFAPIPQVYPTLISYQSGIQNHNPKRPSPTLISWGLKMTSSSGLENHEKDMMQSFLKSSTEVLKVEPNQEEPDIDQYLNFDAISVSSACNA